MRKQKPPRDPATQQGWRLISQEKLQGDSNSKKTAAEAQDPGQGGQGLPRHAVGLAGQARPFDPPGTGVEGRPYGQMIGGKNPRADALRLAGKNPRADALRLARFSSLRFRRGLFGHLADMRAVRDGRSGFSAGLDADDDPALGRACT